MYLECTTKIQPVINYHRLDFHFLVKLPPHPQPTPRDMAMKTVIYRMIAELDGFFYFFFQFSKFEAVSEMVFATV